MTVITNVRGDTLRNALDEFNILGEPLKQAIIQHIASKNFELDFCHSYTLEEIERVLAQVFGKEAARLIIQRLRGGIRLKQ